MVADSADLGCIQEVGMRDGLQSAGQFVTTEDKVRLIDQLSKTGLSKIEVTSFVSPKAVPLLADAEEVLAAINRQPSVTYSALIPNRRGLDRALGLNPAGQYSITAALVKTGLRASSATDQPSASALTRA